MNMCNKGEKCQFSHDVSLKTGVVCHYFKMGNCWFGDECR